MFHKVDQQAWHTHVRIYVYVHINVYVCVCLFNFQHCVDQNKTSWSYVLYLGRAFSQTEHFVIDKQGGPASICGELQLGDEIIEVDNIPADRSVCLSVCMSVCLFV